MKHDWQPVRKTAATFMTQDKRVCLNCGSRQELYIEHAWMRVVGRTWTPKVGRCQPKKAK